MKSNLLFIVLAVVLTSCYKEEIPIPPHEPGDAVEVQVEMGQDYRNQLFYSLSENAIISANLKNDWDIAFESDAAGGRIILNTSKGMGVHQSTQAFDAIMSDAGLSWSWDAHSGNLDSTAFGDWQADNYLYVVDLGYDHLGDHQGYKKIRITGMTSTDYTIEYGDISDAVSQTFNITKNTETLFTYFKFDQGIVSIAPPNEEWDLLFGQYTHLFADPLTPYVVTGVLLNRYNTSAVSIDSKPFNEVTYDDALSLTYANNIDYIGYNWKWYDYENGIFIIDPSTTYIIRTSQDEYYKLHFVDFYNSLGEKGAPKMEIQKL